MSRKLTPQSQTLRVGYTNHRGEFAMRNITPMNWWYGTTEWHPEPGWLVRAWDEDREAIRDFAWAGFFPRDLEANTPSYGLMAPDGRLVAHAAGDAHALFDFLALVGAIPMEGAQLTGQRMLATGWNLCLIEFQVQHVMTEAEAASVLAASTPARLYGAQEPAADGVVPRAQRRIAVAAETRGRATGEWGAWQRIATPAGIPGHGWCNLVRAAWKNKCFAVLDRFVESTDGLMTSRVRHLAVSSLSGTRPTWWEMQRIKNEIAGPNSTAVEIYPPQGEVVDGADMFHIWVLPSALGFGLRMD